MLDVFIFLPFSLPPPPPHPPPPPPPPLLLYQFLLLHPSDSSLRFYHCGCTGHCGACSYLCYILCLQEHWCY